MTEIFKAGFGNLIRSTAVANPRRYGVPQEIAARLPDLSRDGLAISDLREKGMALVYVNRAFQDITGYSSDELIGRKFKLAPLMQRVGSEGGLQTLRVKSPVDGQDRLGSAAPLTNFPFVVIATNTVEAALADWRAQTRFMVLAATLSAAVVAFILFLIVRLITRQNRDVQQRYLGVA